MNTQKTKVTKQGFDYLTPSGKSYHIPRGMLCVRVPGTATHDGKKVRNPWCLHETPWKYLEDQEFLRYARTHGIVVPADLLTDFKAWHKEFQSCANEPDTYLGTLKDGKGVPPEVVLQWARDFVSSDYWKQYDPAKLLSVWGEVWQHEAESPKEFAAETLENCEWELYAKLRDTNTLAHFSFSSYWEHSLRYDYHMMKWEDQSGVIHLLFMRSDW